MPDPRQASSGGMFKWVPPEVEELGPGETCHATSALPSITQTLRLVYDAACTLRGAGTTSLCLSTEHASEHSVSSGICVEQLIHV